MLETSNLPEIDDITEFLSSLCAGDVAADVANDLDENELMIFANYTDDDNATRQFIACDINAAAILGAALTSVPPAMAEESIASKELAENIYASLEEVLNIAANIFPESREHRIAIEKISQGDEAVAEFKKCGDVPRVQLNIEVPRYGKGKVVIGAT